jgi:hypothetical protein
MRTPESDMPFLLRCNNALNLTGFYTYVKHFFVRRNIVVTLMTLKGFNVF